MNITRLSWRNLVSNPLNTTLSLLLMTLGVGIISLLLLLNNEVEQQLDRNLKGIDMVVGAKGSPLQLILSSVYHIDNPTGNISLAEVNKLKKNRMVKSTIPLSFGDSYKGYRIVGTTHDYLNLYEAELKEGNRWSQSLEAVVGSTVAELHNLQIGDSFYGSHGLVEGGAVHDHHAYQVVGILKPSGSVLDKLILTNSESVWDVHSKGGCSHEHEDGSSCQHGQEEDLQITAALVQFKSPVGLIQLPRKVNETTKLQAAVPVFEVNRLMSLMGVGMQSIQLIAIIIMIVSGLSIFISLYNSLKRRRYELALMRVHGASRWQLVQLVLQESLLLSLFGTLFGLLVSRGSMWLFAQFLGKQYSISNIPLHFITEELWLFPIALLIGLLAALIPTIQTYKMDIPKILADA